MPSVSDLRRRETPDRRTSSRGVDNGQSAQSGTTEAKAKAKGQTNMERWLDPPVVADARPSYEDHGGSAFNVVEHLQPLGEAPNARVKARLRSDGSRKSLLSRSMAAAEMENSQTPEPAGTPQRESTPIPAHVAMDDDKDDDYAPTTSTRRKERASRARTGQRGSDAALPPTDVEIKTQPAVSPATTTPQHSDEQAFFYNGEKLKNVVEAAKTRAYSEGKPNLAAAVQSIYETSLHDFNLRMLLEATLTSSATASQKEQFQEYVRTAKQALKQARNEQKARKGSTTASSKPVAQQHSSLSRASLSSPRTTPTIASTKTRPRRAAAPTSTPTSAPVPPDSTLITLPTPDRASKHTAHVPARTAQDSTQASTRTAQASTHGSARATQASTNGVHASTRAGHGSPHAADASPHAEDTSIHAADVSPLIAHSSPHTSSLALRLPESYNDPVPTTEMSAITRRQKGTVAKAPPPRSATPYDTDSKVTKKRNKAANKAKAKSTSKSKSPVATPGAATDSSLTDLTSAGEDTKKRNGSAAPKKPKKAAPAKKGKRGTSALDPQAASLLTQRKTAVATAYGIAVMPSASAGLSESEIEDDLALLRKPEQSNGISVVDRLVVDGDNRKRISAAAVDGEDEPPSKRQKTLTEESIGASDGKKRSAEEAELDNEEQLARDAKVREKMRSGFHSNIPYANQESNVRTKLLPPKPRSQFKGRPPIPKLKLRTNGASVSATASISAPASAVPSASTNKSTPLDADSPLSDVPQEMSDSNSTNSKELMAVPKQARRAKTKTSPQKKQVASQLSPDEDDDEVASKNNDECSVCHAPGYLICCETCPRAFHPACIDLDDNAPELDEPFYCITCYAKRPVPQDKPDKQHTGLFGPLLNNLNKIKAKTFSLPAEIRNNYKSISTGRNGEFMEDVILSKVQKRTGYAEPPDYLRMFDKDKKPVLCYHCNKATWGKHPIIICDHCSIPWHFDCLDPPLTHQPKLYKDGKKIRDWMCPLHADHFFNEVDVSLLAPRRSVHLRERKDASGPPISRAFVDILSDGESDGPEFSDADERSGGEDYGGVERPKEKMPRKGISLNFIDRVKERKRNDAVDRAVAAREAYEAATAELKAALLALKQQPAEAPTSSFVGKTAFGSLSSVEQETVLFLVENATARREE